jgi:hypothetical protein
MEPMIKFSQAQLRDLTIVVKRYYEFRSYEEIESPMLQRRITTDVRSVMDYSYCGIALRLSSTRLNLLS